MKWAAKLPHTSRREFVPAHHPQYRRGVSPMHRVLKWLGPFSAAGIGFMLNLAVSVAAYAGVISPRTVDPQWVALAAAAGGLVWPWST